MYTKIVCFPFNWKQQVADFLLVHRYNIFILFNNVSYNFLFLSQFAMHAILNKKIHKAISLVT